MKQSPLLTVPPAPKPTTVQLVESLLFIAGEPVTIAQLARTLELPEKEGAS